MNFFKTLAKLKSNDPSIFDKSKKFFDEEVDAGDEDGDTDAVQPKKKKPMYLKDYEREQLLTKGEKAFQSDDEDGE